MMYPEEVNLEEKSKWLRREILEMCGRAEAGHVSSAFSCVEILVALYYGGILRFDPRKPDWDERDWFILSKGHAAPALFCVLTDSGFFPADELNNFCRGGILGSHPDTKVPGIEAVTGSLGHGLGISAGLALAAKMDRKLNMTVVLLSDGECYEGSTWEAAMFASHHQLNNLVAIVDRNMLSATDFTENALGLNPLGEKWRTFGWEVAAIDGHSFKEIFSTFKDFRSYRSSKPLMIIANTTKGKGVSFLENNPLAHALVPKGKQLEQAREELDERRLL